MVNNINNDLKHKIVSSHEVENDPQQRKEDQPDILPGGIRLDTTQAVPVLGNKPTKIRNTAKRKLSADEREKEFEVDIVSRIGDEKEELE